MNPIEVAQAFIEAINARSPDRMAALMTENHVFIDSDGVEVAGRENMRVGWEGYFRMVPDYRISARETFGGGQTVVLLGIADGTFSEHGRLFPDNHWSVPAAWRAVIEGNQVVEWQVYVNPEPMRAILDRIQAAETADET